MELSLNGVNVFVLVVLRFDVQYLMSSGRKARHFPAFTRMQEFVSQVWRMSVAIPNHEVRLASDFSRFAMVM